jgi:succinate-semialdehyde dehydrogenase/glutarate-semialdehyde dehydrogenase
VPVGKQLAALAGAHMKRITMELGGHSPVLVFDDAEVERAADMLVAFKFRNAGQVCVSPTRFYIQSAVYERFVARFIERTKAIQVGETGSFFAPTVLTDIADDSLVMTTEPFGPIAPCVPFKELDEVLARANSLPYGLSSYVFTSSTRTALAVQNGLESGMININHFGQALAETPFGGVKDSGIGSEGGTETFDGYLVTKFVTQMD